MLMTLSACATKVASDRYNFSAIDSQDNSKRFTYGFSVRRAADGSSSTDGEPRVSSRPRRQESADFMKMRDALENYMEDYQYCKEGYFVYNETFDGRHFLLHGECQESLTRE